MVKSWGRGLEFKAKSRYGGVFIVLGIPTILRFYSKSVILASFLYFLFLLFFWGLIKDALKNLI